MGGQHLCRKMLTSNRSSEELFELSPAKVRRTQLSLVCLKPRSCGVFQAKDDIREHDSVVSTIVDTHMLTEVCIGGACATKTTCATRMVQDDWGGCEEGMLTGSESKRFLSSVVPQRGKPLHHQYDARILEGGREVSTGEIEDMINDGDVNEVQPSRSRDGNPLLCRLHSTRESGISYCLRLYFLFAFKFVHTARYNEITLGSIE